MNLKSKSETGQERSDVGRPPLLKVPSSLLAWPRGFKGDPEIDYFRGRKPRKREPGCQGWDRQP